MRRQSNQDIPLQSLTALSTYQAGVTQAAAHRLLEKFTNDCLRDHGITTMQWFIIGTIYDAGSAGIGITELSKVVDTNVPYITNTLNKLQGKGIVIRESSTEDRRGKRSKINPAFVPMVEIIEADLRDKMRGVLYANITAAELRTYITVLYKINRSLDC